MAGSEGPIIRRDGVRLLANSPDALVGEMARLRASLRATVAEIKPEGCPILIDEHFDGVWALGMKAAVKNLRATGIQVNELWASLDPKWVCPCCNRSKASMVHLSDGVLIASAVDHHDHFTSYVSQSLTRQLGSEWAKNAPHLLDIQRQMTEAFRAFSPTVICESCNKADGDAKRVLREKLGIAKAELEYFSFAVDEIRGFISSSKHRHHVLNDTAVIELFQSKRKQEVLRFRMETVDQQVGLAVQDVHWRSPESHPSGADLYEETWDVLSELGLTPGGNFELLEYSATTRTGTMPANTWRRNRDRRTTAPSDAKIKEYFAARPHLSALGPNWRCPCCRRSISAIVRLNNKREVTMQIGPVGAGDSRSEVCMDCLDVWRGLAKEADVARDDVTSEDVLAVIRPVRNSRHKLPSHLATDRRIAAIAERTANRPSRKTADDDGFVTI